MNLHRLNKMHISKFLVASIAILFTSSLLALTPTVSQVSNFKALPEAQQNALLEQYGVNERALLGVSGAELEAEAGRTSVMQSVLQDAIPRRDKRAAEEGDSNLALFGYDVFRGDSLGVTVVDNLPVPLDYPMGPGDVISVQIFGKVNQTMSLTINREGEISLPDIGPVSVAGQTFSQMRQQLSAMIKLNTIGIDVSISMGAMRTMQIYIVGEAVQSGAYNVNGLTTITQALIASGGVKNSGSLRSIKLMRKGELVSEFDLYDLIIKGDTSKDARLLAGDTLLVPLRKNRVSIDGQVVRPAVYEVKDDTTISQLLSLAGGASPQAYLSKVSVLRTDNVGLKQITLDLSTSEGKEFIVKNGDKVNFLGVSMTLKNAVVVRGEVTRQGAVNFKPGMKVSDVVGTIEDGLKPTADLSYALLVREVDAKKNIEVLQFSLLDALSDVSSQSNLVLQEKDQIFVFDNGLSQSYWIDSLENAKAKVNPNKNAASNGEFLDKTTGAVVEATKESTLEISGTEEKTYAANTRKASREALLKPIVDRLKEQATYGQNASLVEVTGSVKFPGVYPLTKNISVASLLAAAGGLTEQAYLNSAELSRRVTKNDISTVERINFSLKDAINGERLIRLAANDTLIVKSQPGWQEGMVIELQGEFMFPGTYTFKRGETLSDIVQRAGGFTQFAYPAGAVLSRERLKQQEADRIQLLNEQLKKEIKSLALLRNGSSSISSSQALSIVEQLENVEPVGRLVIDVNAAMNGDKIADLMLEKNDKLFIPALNPVVSIIGEVQFESNHTFKPNFTVDDYISSAGGTKRQADMGRVYIVKANGSVELPNNSFWFSRNYQPLSPGDTIIVPTDIDYLDGLSTITTATQILYQMGVAWSAIKN